MESVALESIFGDDFQVKYSSPLCWSIRISPHSTGEGVENHVLPKIEITRECGLTDEQLEQLYDVAAESAKENLGIPMVYSITEELRAWLQDHNEPSGEKSMYASMLERVKEAEIATGCKQPLCTEAFNESECCTVAEEDITLMGPNRPKRIEGDPVDVASFSRWKALFTADLCAYNDPRTPQSGRRKGRDYFAVSSIEVSQSAPKWEILFEGEDRGSSEDEGA